MSTGPNGKPHHSGLAVYDFDQATDAFGHVETIAGMHDPTYLARHRICRFSTC